MDQVHGARTLIMADFSTAVTVTRHCITTRRQTIAQTAHVPQPMTEFRIQQGWLHPARHIPSANHDERPPDTAVDLLVIHSISLPPGEYGGPWIDALFTNSLDPQQHDYFRDIYQLQVSSHLLIDRRGEVRQYVPLDKRAWHAGVSSFEGREGCNDFSIGIELEGTDQGSFEAIQYRQLAAVTRVIMAAYPGITRGRITGHSDIAPGRKTDPGSGFDWDNYRQLLETD